MSCYKTDLNQHHLLNLNLPEEIIQHIVSYLSSSDLISLCCSNLFAPCLRNSPWFFKRMNKHFVHFMLSAWMKSNNMFTLCAIKPAVLNGNFYFSVNQDYISFFTQYYPNQFLQGTKSQCFPGFQVRSNITKEEKKDNITFYHNPFEPFLSLFSSLFLPYTQFKKYNNLQKKKFKHFQKKKPLSMVKSMMKCKSNCRCSTFHFPTKLDTITGEYIVYSLED